MKTKFKRVLCILLILTVAVCIAIPANVSATDEILTGSCGASAYWSIFSDNVLAITGTGAISDYNTSSSKAPWANYYYISAMSFMQKIVIANGITTIGDYAFYMNTNDGGYAQYTVNNITLPDSLTTIGDHAFENESKIQNIAIPQRVTSIGESAFAGCTSLETVNIYCNPDDLTWDVDKSGLPEGCVIHLKEGYDTPENREKFSEYNPVFDLTHNPNTVYANKKILASYENATSATFGGAHPYSIKLVDANNNIWPITNGSRGFPTCVRYGGNYYMITDNSGVLKKVTLDDNSRASGTTDETLSGLSLKVSNEYIGNYSVKMIYTVKNTGSSSITFDMGSSGDIQIGTDDRAKIEPLKKDENQIGITMTSTRAGDTIDSKQPTLGFIGKAVGGSADDADFFYGAVTMTNNDNLSDSTATAVKADKLMPERIFEPTYKSILSGKYDDQKDSGLSFHWDNIELAPGEEKQYAVIFTVPYTETAATAAETSEKITKAVIDEVKSNIGAHPEDTYVTSNPVKTIFFRNELQVAQDDTLAQINDYSELQNFLLLGVQKKPEQTQRNCLRYVTIVNTNILRDAKEYGYIVAQVTKETDDQYINLRQYINQVKYDSANIYKKNVKGTSNEVSGNYGIFDADTPYKYVTLGINDVPDTKILIVRFYVKKENENPQYADYYTDLKTKKNRYDGCSADWDAVVNAANGS